MAVVAVGNFDGVHLGHQSILKTVVLKAEEINTDALALTFTKHPKNVISNSIAVKYLTDIKFKEKKIIETGIKKVVFIDFTPQFAALDDKAFISMLIEKYDCKVIACGENFRFGKNAAYGITELKKTAKDMGVEVITIPLLQGGISSTSIRTLIENGEIEKANDMLGYEFSYKSLVVPGKQLGRTIGFPTFNQKVDDSYVVPKRGVYLSYIMINEDKFYAVTNIGKRPTVNADDVSEILETHIISSFRDDFLEKSGELRVYFLKRLRDEKKFSSIPELSNQLRKDCEIAKKFFR